MNIDHDLLVKHGICMNSDLEEQMLLELLTEQHEIEVGKRVGERMTDEEERAFDVLVDSGTDEEILDFLEEHVPEFEEIIRMTDMQLDEHLRRHREDYLEPLEIDRALEAPIPVPEGIRKQYLKRRSLHTVGDLLAHTLEELVDMGIPTLIARRMLDDTLSFLRRHVEGWCEEWGEEWWEEEPLEDELETPLVDFDEMI